MMHPTRSIEAEDLYLPSDVKLFSSRDARTLPPYMAWRTYSDQSVIINTSKYPIYVLEAGAAGWVIINPTDVSKEYAAHFPSGKLIWVREEYGTAEHIPVGNVETPFSSRNPELHINRRNASRMVDCSTLSESEVVCIPNPPPLYVTRKRPDNLQQSYNDYAREHMRDNYDRTRVFHPPVVWVNHMDTTAELYYTAFGRVHKLIPACGEAFAGLRDGIYIMGERTDGAEAEPERYDVLNCVSVDGKPSQSIVTLYRSCDEAHKFGRDARIQAQWEAEAKRAEAIRSDELKRLEEESKERNRVLSEQEAAVKFSREQATGRIKQNTETIGLTTKIIGLGSVCIAAFVSYLKVAGATGVISSAVGSVGAIAGTTLAAVAGIAAVTTTAVRATAGLIVRGARAVAGWLGL